MIYANHNWDKEEQLLEGVTYYTMERRFKMQLGESF